jgi:DNA-binding winged helix-turn-helix (wHTH) protein
MKSRGETKKAYEFDQFVLETGTERRLLHHGKTVAIKDKALRLLQLLVESRGKPVERGRLLGELWPHQDVEDNNIDQLVAVLRKKMGNKPNGGQYLETVPRVGFMFAAEVKEKGKASPEISLVAGTVETHGRQIGHIGNQSSGTWLSTLEGDRKPNYRRFDLSNPVLAVTALVLSVITATLIATVFSREVNDVRTLHSTNRIVSAPADEAEVKRVVKESQVFETLGIYVNPNGFDETKLNEYWLPAEQGGKAILQVNKQIASLRGKGRHFGEESELRQFEFRDVRIHAGREYAEVRTEEKWYVPLYEADGSRVMDKNPILAYPVDYMLRKVNGKWLLEENGTPRPQENK